MTEPEKTSKNTMTDRIIDTHSERAREKKKRDRAHKHRKHKAVDNDNLFLESCYPIYMISEQASECGRGSAGFMG